MSTKYDFYQNHLEWETTEEGEMITNLTFETGMYKLSKDCITELSRDVQYNLVATISGEANHRDKLDPDIPNGAFTSDKTVT